VNVAGRESGREVGKGRKVEVVKGRKEGRRKR
jgi:hypothetical protein